MQEQAAKPGPARVHLLDELRGASILLMVLYHAAYDLVFLLDVPLPVPFSALQAWQPLIAGGFIAVAGIASQYSRNNVRRVLPVLGAGVLLSLFTYFWMPEQMIVYGILHFLATCMLLFALLRPLLKRVPTCAGFVVCALLFLVTRHVQHGSVGLWGLRLPLPKAWYRVPGLLVLGFAPPEFQSFDYFPLLPWAFLFFAGSFMGVWFRQGKMPRGFYRPHVRWLAAAGRHSLAIYLLHQPVVYGLLYLFFRVLPAL